MQMRRICTVLMVIWSIRCGAVARSAWAEEVRNVKSRAACDNSRFVFETTGKGHVAFMGGSITEMNGYRPMVCEFLVKRFPNTKFTFTDAGISSTCSTTGAFRLERDVLSKGPVDLFFVEFAVNDDQDAGHSRRDCIRGMEGIVRHLRTHNPFADIVITYFVNPGMLNTIQSGKIPLTIEAHEQVAEHYQCTSILLAKEVSDQIKEGKLTWEQYGGTHPKPHGNAIAAGMIEKILQHQWQHPLEQTARKTPHRLPDPIDTGNYGNGHFVAVENAEGLEGWKLQTPNWKQLKGSCRGRFVDATLMCASEPGAVLTLRFDGQAIGAFVLAGPDAGIVEASIDGGPFQSHDLYHHYSAGLHYPRSVMFATDLEPKQHELRLRISTKKNTRSIGHAARLLQFNVN